MCIVVFVFFNHTTPPKSTTYGHPLSRPDALPFLIRPAIGSSWRGARRCPAVAGTAAATPASPASATLACAPPTPCATSASGPPSATHASATASARSEEHTSELQ